MNTKEYNDTVHMAVERDKAVVKVQDASNLVRDDVRTVVSTDGKRITLRLYGR